MGFVDELFQQKIDSVTDLLGESYPSDSAIVVRKPCLRLLVPEWPLENIVGLDSAVERVWTHIEDENVRIIRLCGTGGIGKTTLLKKVSNEFHRRSHDFDAVIWAEVPRQEDYVEIVQEALRKKLDIPDEVWNRSSGMYEKGAQISSVLKGISFVLLLDNVWEQFGLTGLGIHLRNDHKQSKVIFTARSLELQFCKEADVTIEVKFLSEEQSWRLFRMTVGESRLSNDPDLSELANTLARRCAGLPLALLTVAGAMACRETLPEWRHTDELLHTNPWELAKMGAYVLPLLKFSYDSLDDAISKKCFLYCSIFPKDYNIRMDELIDLWIGEGFLDGPNPFDQGEFIIGNLKRAHLLENDASKRCVWMHDILRHMALWLARDQGKNKNRVLVAKSARITVQELTKWEEANWISLFASRGSINHSPSCPHLSTLLLRDAQLESFPSGFFDSMPALKVLDLSGNQGLVELPSDIGNVKNLLYLNLSSTSIAELPTGLRNFRKLRCLLLDYTMNLKWIPKEVISELLHLQVFSKIDGVTDTKRFASLEVVPYDEVGLLEVLKCLNHINKIGITIFSAPSLEKIWKSYILRSCIRKLTLMGCADLVSLYIRKDLSNLERLELFHCGSIEEFRVSQQCQLGNLSKVYITACPKLLNLSFFAYAGKLEILTIIECELLKEVTSENMAFRGLKTLSLTCLQNLQSICPSPECFPSLLEIEVSKCPCLKQLPFDLRSANSLQKIRGETEWWDGLIWDDEAVKDACCLKYVSTSDDAFPFGRISRRSEEHGKRSSRRPEQHGGIHCRRSSRRPEQLGERSSRRLEQNSEDNSRGALQCCIDSFLEVIHCCTRSSRRPEQHGERSSRRPEQHGESSRRPKQHGERSSRRPEQHGEESSSRVTGNSEGSLVGVIEHFEGGSSEAIGIQFGMPASSSDSNSCKLPPIQPSMQSEIDESNRINLENIEAIKVIGTGTGGIVQLVKHKRSGQFFALKIIQTMVEESVLEHISMKLELTRSFRCPYIIVCYKSFYNNGAISMILEYMDGGSLADFLEKVKFIPEPYLAAICEQVLKGFMYLHHEKHIIHRDIKPSNLLINTRGEVKITDLGLSTRLKSISGRANTFVGTYSYMSPERIMGGSYDNTADIWSLGLVLLECATGKFPYSPPEQAQGWTNFYELMEEIVEQPPPCASSDQFSPEFCSFIFACLQKDPKKRKSSDELLAMPFLNMYDGMNVNLSSYFTNAGVTRHDGMMKKRKGILNPNLKLSLLPPAEISFAKFLTESGTFKDSDLLVNKDRVRIVSQSEPAALPLIKPSETDNDSQLSLEDFDAIKVIGKGNGGIVQLVQHKWTGQFFALKIIQMNIEESARKQIAKGLKINQSSQCPYVVVCYQSFYINGAISIILEYMDGGSLADFLKKVKSIPEPYLAVICKQMLKGFMYLHHEKHIIHRDIKPSNLLINTRGKVKITDLGLSTRLKSISGRANTFVGTYSYMSPERIMGGSYDNTADIWSLGLVLLECATGKFPYSPLEQAEGWTNFYELMEEIVEQPPPCASSDQFSPEFCSFISACLQKDPKKRKSSDELLAMPFLNMYDDMNVNLSSYFTNPGITRHDGIESGTFKDSNLLVNKYGVRIVSQSEPEALPLIKPSETDNDSQLSLEDIDVIKVIGKGNGGIVQLVQHKWTGQFFALKIIQMNIEESARKQIAKELKINQSFQCPYVVVCYQSFYINGAISIILEYMDGGSLADFLKKVKSIPEPYLAAICKQVLKGLMYLHHERHIIHRDLKPSNLLINHRGEVKITDFGVSAIMTSTSGLANTFVGTYYYMSPERIIGGDYGNKSDIWSLGLVLLECATGQFPYSPEQAEKWTNFYELKEQIVEQPPPCAPSEQFSPEFCSFISACLKKDPKERKSAHELLAMPFLNMYDDLEVDLSSYFNNAGSPLATL